MNFAFQSYNFGYEFIGYVLECGGYSNEEAT
ncbi:hypothetical protein [Peribacillus butanolivorans]